jgi:pyruvate,water dikinase
MLIKNMFKYWTYQVFSPGTVLREKYEAFKSLLSHDKKAHELMAELEEIYYNQARVDFTVIQEKYEAFYHSVRNVVEDLAKICPTRYLDLPDYLKKFDFYIRFMLAPREFSFSAPFTVMLPDIPADGEALAGGKALNLSTIGTQFHIPMPKGFVVTTNAFHYFIEYNNLRKSIDRKLSQLDINSTESLDTASHELHELIKKASIPPAIAEAIHSAFKTLQEPVDKQVKVAVRSSAVGEDTRSSFAGQYLTELNISQEEILASYQKVIASKYSPWALYYRINYGLSDIETPMAVLVLEMIDAKASGILYTKNLETSAANQLSVHAIRGLGELLAGGEISPDIFVVSKKEKPDIVEKKSGGHSKKMIISSDNTTEIVPVENTEKALPVIDDSSVLTLAGWGIKLESHYKEPLDIEWCMDQAGHLFLLQSRPLQTEEFKPAAPVECNFEDIRNELLVSDGETASSGIGAGQVYKIEYESDLNTIPQDSVLVARSASPSYAQVMNKLNAVVTDAGSTAGHFSSVAREFGVPALVSTKEAFSKLAQGAEVTVHADARKVYAGIVHEMLESPCARRNLITDSPFMRKLSYIMSFVSSLRLVDPQADYFKPQGCRSLHDIIRFAHEKAVQEMFHLGDKRMRKIGGSRKLKSAIPMLFYVLDVGGGLGADLKGKKEVKINNIKSVPMQAVMRGLGHPDIQWGDFTHFDWAEHDRIVMSGGIISPEAAMFASHAVVSNDYANLNLRFGYHFVIVDSVCGDSAEDNYILFRFSGGGADYYKRQLRADFLSRILERLEFEVTRKSDLVDGRFNGGNPDVMMQKLDMIGRLLGATRLMDMYLKDESMVEKYTEEFLQGRYHFASVE